MEVILSKTQKWDILRLYRIENKVDKYNENNSRVSGRLRNSGGSDLC